MLGLLQFLPPYVLLGVTLLLLFGISYYRDSIRFQKAYSLKQSRPQQPPKYPTWVPYFGSFIPFILDSHKYLHRAT